MSIYIKFNFLHQIKYDLLHLQIKNVLLILKLDNYLVSHQLCINMFIFSLHLLFPLQIIKKLLICFVIEKKMKLFLLGHWPNPIDKDSKFLYFKF